MFVVLGFTKHHAGYCGAAWDLSAVCKNVSNVYQKTVEEFQEIWRVLAAIELHFEYGPKLGFKMGFYAP